MTSRDQSNIVPICFACSRMRSMFAIVHLKGWMLFRMAAFSAGSPKASKP
jgi:hypothetical protein